jgi:hypothetical protein
VVGYLIWMLPWMVRNLVTFGTLLSPASAKMLWLTNYNQLYSYPTNELTFHNWLAVGMPGLIESIRVALLQNLQTLFVVQGQIILLPLVLVGLVQLRFHPIVHAGVLAWLGTFFIMSFIFPHAGWRGGFFHSGAALQPLVWLLCAVGLHQFVEWGRRVRHWEPAQALPIFRTGLLGFCALISLFAIGRRVVGPNFEKPIWNSSSLVYYQVERSLQMQGARTEQRVLVNNPPGYFLASGRQALVIPEGGLETALAVAERYRVDYLLLDQNHPTSLVDLYMHPGSQERFKKLAQVGEVQIYQIIQDW